MEFHAINGHYSQIMQNLERHIKTRNRERERKNDTLTETENDDKLYKCGKTNNSISL